MEKKTGTVVKFTEKYIVLIMPDGSFKNIKRSRRQVPLIGERFAIGEKRAPVLIYQWAAMAAVACLILAVILKAGLFMPDKIAPAYTIALDINPSIEIQTDKEFKIIGIEGLNEDGKKIIGETVYLNIDLFETLEGIVGKCIDYSYLKQEKEGLIKITIIPMQGQSFKYEKRIGTSLQNLLKSRNINSSLEIGTASKETLEEAHQFNLSINRYIYYQELKETGMDLTIEEAGKIPLQELKDYEEPHKEGADKASDGKNDNMDITDENNSEVQNGSNSDKTSQYKDDTGSVKEGKKQNGNTGLESSGIPEMVDGDNTVNVSGNVEMRANPGDTGNEEGQMAGKDSANDGTTDSAATSDTTTSNGNVMTPEPTNESTQSNKSDGSNQAPNITNNSGAGNGISGPSNKH